MSALRSTGSIATARWADPDYIANRYYFTSGDFWIGRNPHNADQAIGYSDKRHVMICAGTRSGKGRSLVVNNLALWPGSIVNFDPKGDLPNILAARRGHGDQYCDGMGQDVFVLDPLNHSGVAAEYLAYFDPLSGLDPEDKDGELATWAKRIARSLIQIDEGTQGAEWAKRAVRLIALMIMHVLTSENFDDDERNLMTVLRLLMEGAEDVLAHIRAKRPDLSEKDLPDPMFLLLDEMTENQACRGWIASDARSLRRQAETTPKFFESVRGEATDQLDWFKSAGIERSLKGWGDKTRRFDPLRLKSDPMGISVFIVMPVDDLETYSPWVQCVFLGIFAAMRSTKAPPASGHQVLAVLDEFSSLGYQEYISTSLDNIAGAGMKLAIVVQNYGTLKKLYGEKMESFFTNSGLEIYFGRVGETATDYLKKELGETEIVKVARSENTSQSQSDSVSTAIAFGETSGTGGSETLTDTQSTAYSQSTNWNWSNGVNWSDSKNWGKSNGKNMGSNYGPHIFFEGLEHSNSYGTSLNYNTGASHTHGGSKTKGGGGSKGKTETSGQSRAQGSSWNRSTSRTETTTASQSRSNQIGSGLAESFHKKPLLEAHEINAYLRPLEEEDIDHPAYPGMALVRIQGESPFFVRRSNYDQDGYFERCFSTDPAHKFLPLNEQPLLGYQYTENHVLEIRLPDELADFGGYVALTDHRPPQIIPNDIPLFNYGKSQDVENGAGDSALMPEGRIRVLAVGSEDGFVKKGSIISIKRDIAFDAEFKNTFGERIFAKELEAVREQKRRSIEQTKRIEAAKAQREREERRRLETDRQNAIRYKTLRAELASKSIKYFIGWAILSFFSLAGVLALAIFPAIYVENLHRIEFNKAKNENFGRLYEPQAKALKEPVRPTYTEGTEEYFVHQKIIECMDERKDLRKAYNDWNSGKISHVEFKNILTPGGIILSPAISAVEAKKSIFAAMDCAYFYLILMESQSENLAKIEREINARNQYAEDTRKYENTLGNLIQQINRNFAQSPAAKEIDQKAALGYGAIIVISGLLFLAISRFFARRMRKSYRRKMASQLEELERLEAQV